MPHTNVGPVRDHTNETRRLATLLEVVGNGFGEECCPLGSPDGAIERFTARFNQPMVALGDPRAASPFIPSR